MSSTFTSNFKNLLLIIVKSASEQGDCPVSYTLVKAYIDNTFTSQYEEENRRIFKKYRTKVESFLKSKDSSIEEAIAKEDRSIFNALCLLPDDMAIEYKGYAEWYMEYLRSKMPSTRMSLVFRYIRTLKNQV